VTSSSTATALRSIHKKKWQPDLKAAHDETHYLGLGLFVMM